MILKSLLFAIDLDKTRQSIWNKEPNIQAVNIFENISFEMSKTCRNPERRVKRYFMISDDHIYYSKVKIKIIKRINFVTFIIKIKLEKRFKNFRQN